MVQIIRLRKDDLGRVVELVADVLKKDGLVVMPSDTVYILVVNANSTFAVEKIFAFKGRHFGKAVSIFLPNLKSIKEFTQLSRQQEEILKTLLPGYFTVVLKSKHRTASAIEADDETIGIRVVDNPLINRLTNLLPFPITATSANLSGKGPHYSIDAFLQTLSEKKKKMISLIVDAGPLPRIPPSTVLRLVKDEIEILRQGTLNPHLIKSYRAPKSEDTKKTAQKIYQSIWAKELAKKSVVVVLRGDLGAGKTVFAQGIGELFGEQLSSPTFVLMDEYQINQPPLKNLYHLDLYRLENETEIKELKLGHFLKRGNLLLIEWGEKLATFRDLKNKGVSFYWLQIEEKERERRELKLYRL